MQSQCFLNVSVSLVSNWLGNFLKNHTEINAAEDNKSVKACKQHLLPVQCFFQYTFFSLLRIAFSPTTFCPMGSLKPNSNTSLLQSKTGGSDGKEPACRRPRLLSQEGQLEKGMATHSSILAWEIPWTEERQWATVHEVTKSQTRLMTNTFTFHRG